jgi:signal transduction histidine kinase
MSEPNPKIETLQRWVDTLRKTQASEPENFHVLESTLNSVLDAIGEGDRPRLPPNQDMALLYADLERQVHEQTTALNRATTALKDQISERENTARKLRKAYNDLEVHLKDHIAYQSELNQRLFKQIEEQKRTQNVEKEERILTEALRDTLTAMSSTLDLDKILDHILDTVRRITPYDGANVLLVESDLVHVVRQRGYLEKGMDASWLNQRIPVAKLAILQQLIDLGKPVAIPDTSTSPMWIGFPDLAWVNSNVIVPIRSNGKILGFLSLDSATPGFFTQAHAERLQTFADQAAIAIQNARLLERAKHSAVMAERSRLANELHDTISQTLWSISLITERLPSIWAKDQEAGKHSLITLHQFAQNALAEMRSLLLELHPSSLNNTKLGDLIHQIADIIGNRTGLKISVKIEGQDPVPPEVHFALYRVVQEALNNIVLHALARHVEIYFNSSGTRIDLTIYDDGQGFIISDVDTGRLGLSIMKDRVQNIGGVINITSKKGEGTSVKISWMKPTE